MHEKDISDGSWDSSHLCTIKFNDKGEAIYTLISTIILVMVFNHKTCGIVNLSGNVTKKVIIIMNNLVDRYIQDKRPIRTRISLRKNRKISRRNGKQNKNGNGRDLY
jgi:hypothetical protein